MNFAIITEDVLKKLEATELKVYASILILMHKRELNYDTLSEISKISKRHVKRIIAKLEKKNLIIREYKNNIVSFKIKLNIEYNYDFLDIETNLAINKLVNNKEDADKIAEYLKNKKIKNVKRYLNWILKNKWVLDEENKDKDNIVTVEDVDTFYAFQSYLSKNHIDYNIKVEKNAGKPVRWHFLGREVKRKYKAFLSENKALR